MENQVAFLLVSLLYLSSNTCAGVSTRLLRRVENNTVTLDCLAGDKKPQWFKDDKPVLSSKVAPLIIIDNSGNLKILTGDRKEVFGEYECKVEGGSETTFRVIGWPKMELTSSTTVVEGETLRLSCADHLESGAKLQWTFGNRTYEESEGRVILESDKNGIEAARFVIEKVTMADRGEIKCKISYEGLETELQDKTFLRIKDKYAALWPFLGICAEVIILGAIIILYERNRDRETAEDSDTDQGTDSKNHDNKTDARHRK